MDKKKWRRFQPMTPTAEEKINFILNRGGQIITENKTYVEIKRLSSIARVDQYGRVDWRPE